MSKQRKKIQTSCRVCGRATNDAYVCRRCASELGDLLIGSREVDGQPGIIWYAERLRESAYGQTRMERNLGVRGSDVGYALLGNHRAVELLGRIDGSLARWEATVEALRASHGHEMGWVHMGSSTRDSERLEGRRARFIAAHVVLLRHHCSAVDLLHAEMLGFAREAWRIINRPNDTCCGPCPMCATLLYAEENSTTVQCPNCHILHDVELLRDRLKAQVQDMLFTRAELVNLMETRLNDRIPQSTFTKLLRDGRLQPRKMEQEPLYTYNDVVAARLKEPPRIRSVS